MNDPISDDATGSLAGLALEFKPDRLADVVYEAIRDAIINRVIEPGSRVTEAGIATQLNVSKTPVREALLKLRQVGLVEPVGRRGDRIPLPSPSSIHYAYDAREALESHAARVAADRGAEADLAVIADAAARCLARARSGDLETFMRWDLAFHLAVSLATANPRLIALIDDALALVMALRRRDVPQAAPSLACAEAHVVIADAIGRHAPDEAMHAMSAHVREVEGYVLASLAQDGDGAR
ncbi:MAG TPA: GntR family transcriptional regulator [Solirubrobacteraceae bacterium]|jgi:GntR family transcriptional regulator, rspAB operon transcriptional repressor